MDFENFDLFSESEQLNEQMLWSPQQWWEYYSRDGVLTHGEFCRELDMIIQEIYPES